MASATRTTDPADRELDAVVIGAGVAGLYQLHQLREQGLRVRAYDAADDVGGTWWWHGFPGARVDTEGYLYQYLFSAELYEDWSWSERFPAGYEVLRWLRFLTDRLDLRRDIALSTRVVSAHYDEGRAHWRVRTDRGETIDTRFVVSCAGTLPDPDDVAVEGQADFAGTLLHTARWPWKGPDLAGRRVGVVGIGAPAVQLVPKIVQQVGRLTVFADAAPPYLLPMENPAYGWRDREAYKSRLAEFRDTLPGSVDGFADVAPDRARRSPEQQQALLDELYEDGSLALWRAGTGASRAAGELSGAVSEFVREKMRARLRDPRLIDVLVPTGHPFGARRVPLEKGYLEVFHRDDVDLVDVRDNPVRRLHPEGLELVDGTRHVLDVIVLTAVPDAGPGALARIDVRGRDGRSLAQEWAGDVRTTLGLAKHGFPNLFLTAAPLAPSAALCNTTPWLQHQTEWIARAVRDLRAEGRATIEPTRDGEDAWVAHHDETTAGTPIVDTLSWAPAPEVEDRPRHLSYTGGLATYRRRCEQEAADGYPAFSRT